MRLPTAHRGGREKGDTGSGAKVSMGKHHAGYLPHYTPSPRDAVSRAGV